MSKKLIVVLCLISTGYLLSECSNETEPKVVQKYLNLHDSVGYVGMETCRQCHYEIYQTFTRTGMGSSFGLADTVRSIARLHRDLNIHDPHLNLYYQPYWKNDSLMLREYRLNGTDTTYNFEQYVNYVVGSGQHTNSHIFSMNDYLYQVPFTWYAQEEKLDFPPGYEGGNNSRFERIIGLECMSCHNAMPTGFVMGSENKFTEVPGGINCERCHGPGEVHVKKMMAGELTDTAKNIDYSIVNPSKLNVDLQFQICQRCHLQGNAVLAEGKSFFDFRPGMMLNEVMDVYIPRYSNAEDRFIMASHADRFKMSKCFMESDNYTCTSCHDPHVSVIETKIQKFNSQCQSCHQDEAPIHGCSEVPAELEAVDYNCVSCHMPASGSVDIPHVSVHDHYVRKDMQIKDTSGLSEFLGLVAVNNERPGNRSKALAYLQQYERFEGQGFYLDSAEIFLAKISKERKPQLWIHYYYLRRDYKSVISIVQNLPDIIPGLLREQSYDNAHAWTSHRIGEAFMETGNSEAAVSYYRRAVNLAPYIPDFRHKYGTSLMSLQKLSEASQQFQILLRDNPRHKEALNNLGYIYLLRGEYMEALKLFKRVLKFYPDYLLAWLNIANVYLQLGEELQLEKALEEVLRIDPANVQAADLLERLNR